MSPQEEKKENTAERDQSNKQNTTANNAKESFFARSKRTFPRSSLSDDDSDDADDREESHVQPKRTRTGPIFGSKVVSNTAQAEVNLQHRETITLPVLRILPSLGGRELRFPITPQSTLVELRDFILFSLSIPHFQQVLSFKQAETDRTVSLSSFPEATLLANIRGLIDEVTGYTQPLSLSFKMSSGMDFSPFGNEDFASASETDDSGNSGVYEFDSASNAPGSELASSLASLIPLPPETPPSARVLVRSLSKASASNSNMPTLWEVYLPESNVKMLVSAVINIERKTPPEPTAEPVNESKVEPEAPIKKVPQIVITPPEKESIVAQELDSLKLASNPVQPEPKPYCAKCRLRCRPALRFICKCGLTFCQTHRYPDQHACTFDHRAAGVASLEASNPKIVKDKVGSL